MGINIADNFAYNGKKPMDNRTEYATLSAMKSVVDANINEGCMCYNKEDGKYYTFKSTNTVDATTGKWREFETGGGGQTYNDFIGATASTAGAHGLVPAPSAGDEGKVLFGNGAWGALPSVDLSMLSNEALMLTTTEKPIGMSKSGKILYGKIVEFGQLPNNSAKTVNHGISNLGDIAFMFGQLKATDGAYQILPKTWGVNNINTQNFEVNATQIKIQMPVNATAFSADVYLFYDKSTDSPLPSDVKFAGVTGWGEVKYSKTFTGSFAISPSEYITYNDIVVSNAKHLLNVELVQDDGQLGDYYIATVKGAGFTSDGKLRMQGNTGLTAKYITVTYTLAS